MQPKPNQKDATPGMPALRIRKTGARTNSDLPSAGAANGAAKAVVLSCLGAAESDLSVTRSLGQQGVPVTVISEYDHAPAALSRYCTEHYCLPLFTHAPQKLLEFLIDYARRELRKPILFPTADPDLLIISQLRAALQSHYHLPLASAQLIELLTDKRKFAVFASQHQLPVPATHSPRGPAELRYLAGILRYPVVVKPPHPLAWSGEVFKQIANGKKALIASEMSGLLRAADWLMQHGCPYLLQAYIPGDDAEHYEAHTYLDASSTPRAWFTGKKIRISPPHAGSGCFVRSQYVDEIIAAGLDALRAIGFTGLANLDFKRDPTTGRYHLLEINPRVSQWNILGAECGINLPYIAYADLQGLPYETPPRQRENVYYLNFRNDLRSFLEYRRNKEWSATHYLASLLRRPMIFQLLRLSDPWPFIVSCSGTLRRLLSRLRRAALGRLATALRGWRQAAEN
jgi:predicted ATP-grasp superfamily ATP-dependent carboligase